MSSHTINKWLKNGIAKSGIADNYSGHSTRHISMSKAYKSGLDVNIIKKSAGWSKASQVFSKFYNRPTENVNDYFARLILSLVYLKV